ncbi:hypothetical protein DFH06DRAFT_1151990 [Mycena polygramma]|nr:hypothetical protein DFH06DRAFT_1151990 [Mycena polygramma]
MTGAARSGAYVSFLVSPAHVYSASFREVLPLSSISSTKSQCEWPAYTLVPHSQYENAANTTSFSPLTQGYKHILRGPPFLKPYKPVLCPVLLLDQNLTLTMASRIRSSSMPTSAKKRDLVELGYDGEHISLPSEIYHADLEFQRGCRELRCSSHNIKG